MGPEFDELADQLEDKRLGGLAASLGHESVTESVRLFDTIYGPHMPYPAEYTEVEDVMDELTEDIDDLLSPRITYLLKSLAKSKLTRMLIM